MLARAGTRTAASLLGGSSIEALPDGDPHAYETLHVVPGAFAEALLLRRKYAVMKGAARARLGDARWASSEHTLNLHNPKKGAA